MWGALDEESFAQPVARSVAHLLAMMIRVVEGSKHKPEAVLEAESRHLRALRV